MSPFDIRSTNILVVGLGLSGLAAAELAILHGGNVTVVDANSSPALHERARRLTHRGVEVLLDWSGQRWQRPVDLVVISPGIPPDSVLGRLCAAVDCPVVSELEFGYLFCSCPVIAVTGTNGKTTTVELVTHCLAGAGKRVVAAGNIGLPISDAARKSATLDYLVLEVSSFQLERIERFTPIAAAILNITDDHLDRYPSRQEYAGAKLALLNNLQSPGQVVLRSDLFADERIRELPLFRTGQPVTFSAAVGSVSADYAVSPDRWIIRRTSTTEVPVVDLSQLKPRGVHNVENIQAALALCEMVGLPLATLTPLVRTFAVNAHRLELAAVHQGVKFVNDSKSTNPDSLVQALVTMKSELNGRDGKIILIAGGQNKNMTFSSVVPHLQSGIKSVLLLGESKELIADQWAGCVSCYKFNSLAAAVGAACETAESGDIVLLSPGCASLDMFTSYKDRGNTFIDEIRRRQES